MNYYWGGGGFNKLVGWRMISILLFSTITPLLQGNWPTCLSTLSQMTTFRQSSILKDFADDNSKFDENGGEFSKRIEITI